jgi:predicted ester cyclase
MAHTAVDQATANKQVMHRFVELFQTGKWDDFGQVIARDCVVHYPGGVDVVGLDAMKAGWKVFYGALSDLRATPHAEISEGDTLMEFLTFEATYSGDYLGVQISQRPIKYNQIEIARFGDGKIVEWWVEMDRLWMAEQLGFGLQPK